MMQPGDWKKIMINELPVFPAHAGVQSQLKLYWQEMEAWAAEQGCASAVLSKKHGAAEEPRALALCSYGMLVHSLPRRKESNAQPPCGLAPGVEALGVGSRR